MKRIIKLTALALIVLAGSLPLTASAQYTDGYDGGYDDGYGDRDVSYQTFYDELSPHGRWVDYPGHGYVWVPNAGSDFRPYSTNGHWVWSDNYEWMWVSDYDWGWAPFHYGRWDHDPYYGWYWVPGYEWSPAWVAWRDGGDYYGWAPIRPGINISINFNIGSYAPPVDFWCFTPRRYITYPRIYDYCLPPTRNVTIIHQTNIIVNNFRYGGSYGFRAGPRRMDVERYVGRINPVRFRQSNAPGRTVFRNNEVSVYRPNFRRENNNRNVAPRSFERYDRNNANNNNGFRRNNDVVRNNDNRVANDNRRFERRDNTPDTRDRVDRTNGNNRIERRENNNGNTQPRRFERNDNNQPNRERVNTPGERPQRTREQGNTNPEPRRFERRVENPGNNNNPNREPRVRQQQPERRMEPRQPQPQQRTFERRSEPRQQQPERRVEPRQPQQQQRTFERRSEPRPQQQTQPNRSTERRENGGGNGNGRGRGRF